jgi:hypothetical protein
MTESIVCLRERIARIPLIMMNIPFQYSIACSAGDVVAPDAA